MSVSPLHIGELVLLMQQALRVRDEHRALQNLITVQDGRCVHGGRSPQAVINSSLLPATLRVHILKKKPVKDQSRVN
jgi:hypothetical protein